MVLNNYPAFYIINIVNSAYKKERMDMMHIILYVVVTYLTMM